NPESQSKKAELAFYPERCIGCGNCVNACPNGCHVLSQNRHQLCRSNCETCGFCTRHCSSEALALIGRPVTVDEVINYVLEDSPFYNVSGGGMTISGGEPMFQPEFTLELLKGAKGCNIHTCMETCGFCEPEHLIRAVPYTDLFLFDLKATPDVHQRLTGAPLGPILDSLLALDQAGGRIVLRCPLIPGVNMNESHIKNIAQTAGALKNIIEINLERYHPIGISKCQAIGRKPEYTETKMVGTEEAGSFMKVLNSMTEVPVTVV
ncbi:MAG: glycyl-radical enzyme activating protein, partial [Bacillota bacterium]|nr:glycyl-radical enzyme activating protein [Bacillota bacterium]